MLNSENFGSKKTFLENLDGLDEIFSVETYLSKIPQKNTEMNLLCQKMKFPYQ